MSPRAMIPLALAAWPLLLGLASCGGPEPGKVQVPARALYYEATYMEDEEVYSEAITRLQTLIAENPGTRLGIFAYLRLADIYFKDGKWADAETNYRLFLTLNSNSHLTSYALYRLMVVNYQKSLTGLFSPSREVDRDMAPNRQLTLEFKRFYLLYPNSVYLSEVLPLHRAARETLARYERMVGDFYLKRESYPSAIGRYLFLLRTYPEYPDAGGVLQKLIEAYRDNRQPELAAEMERIYALRFGKNGAGSEPGPATSGQGLGDPPPGGR